jgi:LysM repeat protein
VNLPVEERITLHRYRVKLGDTLGEIAHEFRTHVNLLQEVNKLHHNSIKPGQVLLIPHSAHTLVNYNATNLNATKKMPATANGLKTHSANITAGLNTIQPAGETTSEKARSTQVVASTSRSNITQTVNRTTHKLTSNQPAETTSELAIKQTTGRINLTEVKHPTDSTVAPSLDHTTKTSKSIHRKHPHNKSTQKTKTHTAKSNRTSVSARAEKTFSRRHYHVKAGDTLSKIAKDFGISIATLKKLNHLHSNMLHPGEKLQVP